MKKITFLSFLLFCSLAFWNCQSKSEDTPSPSNPTNPTNPNNAVTEFIAQDADFAGFKNWTKYSELASAMSDDGRAHSNGSRIMWVKQANAARGANGQYPVGTIFVKEVQGYGIVGMAKRGGSFNADHQNWEWFSLNLEGKILNRNSSSLCNNCHLKAKNLDYVFSKP